MSGNGTDEIDSKAAAIARGDDAPEMTPEQEIEHANLRRKAMVNHSVKVLAGQGVKAIVILSVEEAMAVLDDCEPEYAAKTLDLAAACQSIDLKEFLTPFLERVMAGETAASYLESQVPSDNPDVA